MHGPLTRYVKLRVVHTPGMPGRFPRHRLQRKPRVSDPGMHRGTYVMDVPCCMPGSLIRGGGENIPGIPGAFATDSFMYLAKGPLTHVIHHPASMNERSEHKSSYNILCGAVITRSIRASYGVSSEGFNLWLIVCLTSCNNVRNTMLYSTAL